jgi:SAM-dependent methyltransferase
MTSSYENRLSPENEPARHQQQRSPSPPPSETAYERLSAYGFAQRYARGKIVADLCWEEVGYGSHLLAETAESVVSLINSAKAADLARTAYPVPNAEYKKVNLPELPYPEGYFDVAVAFGVVENLERPEILVREARRVLKQDGILIISVPDKRVLLEKDARRVGEAELLWHGDADLRGSDAVIVPGGFSYGDYLRVGAIARFSPVMGEVARFAREGGLVLGICNGFQVLCEAGLLPGALLPNRSLRFVCRQVRVVVELPETPFTRACARGDLLSLPVKHGSGRFHAPDPVLEELRPRARRVRIRRSRALRGAEIRRPAAMSRCPSSVNATAPRVCRTSGPDAA